MRLSSQPVRGIVRRRPNLTADRIIRWHKSSSTAVVFDGFVAATDAMEAADADRSILADDDFIFAQPDDIIAEPSPEPPTVFADPLPVVCQIPAAVDQPIPSTLIPVASESACRMAVAVTLAVVVMLVIVSGAVAKSSSAVVRHEPIVPVVDDVTIVIPNEPIEPTTDRFSAFIRQAIRSAAILLIITGLILTIRKRWRPTTIPANAVLIGVLTPASRRSISAWIDRCAHPSAKRIRDFDIEVNLARRLPADYLVCKDYRNRRLPVNQSTVERVRFAGRTTDSLILVLDRSKTVWIPLVNDLPNDCCLDPTTVPPDDLLVEIAYERLRFSD